MGVPKHAWSQLAGGEAGRCRRCGIRKDWKELSSGGMGWVYTQKKVSSEEKPRCVRMNAADFEKQSKKGTGLR